MATDQNSRLKKLKKSINSRSDAGTLLIIAFAFLLGWNTFQAIMRNYQLQQQADKIQSDIDLLELENKKLSYQVEYLKSDEFIDESARTSLNYKKPGENILIIPKRTKLDTVATTNKPVATSLVSRATDNLKSWYELIISHNNKGVENE